MTPKEYVQQLMNEKPLLISEPTYLETIRSSIREKYYFESNLESILSSLEEMLKEMGRLRSEPTVSYPSNVEKGHLDKLRDMYQPEQKTQEWYDFRQDHITASNAWKALGTNASRNQLIYEKCQPPNTEKFKSSLVETPMSWGNKYEYLTTSIYESRNQTKIGTFGCIAHKDYPFLAASPDGIVIGDTNYGRMIEIKNVVSREITGIPKKDYYIQMQLQMEVCDLEECDFVETKFIEYETENEFKYDLTAQQKGVILVFINESNEFVYQYMPLDVVDYDTWMEDTFSNTDPSLKWFKNVYWKLEVYSCVLVKRQREWFKAAVPFFVSLWDTVLIERVNGEYEQRAPKKRTLKNENKNELKHEMLVNTDGLVCDQTQWRQGDSLIRENISADQTTQ